MTEQRNTTITNNSGVVVGQRRDADRVLCLLEDDDDLPTTNIILQKTTNSGSFNLLSQLEEYLTDCIDDQMIIQQQQLLLPLCYMPRADCSWLACQKPKRLPLTSVLGIIEELEDDDDDDGNDAGFVDREICFTSYRAISSSFTSSRVDDVSYCCSCKVPHNDWNRVNLDNPSQRYHSSVNDNNNNNNIDNNSNVPPFPRRSLFVDWVDLRSHTQKQPDSHGNNNKNIHESSTSSHGHEDDDISKRKSGGAGAFLPLLPTTAASCTHFLRSLLHTSHCASPWWRQQHHQQQCNDNDQDNNKDVVILIINRDSSSNTESSSCQHQVLLDYRVSDACPSWFLHAVLYAKKKMPPPPFASTEFNEGIPYNHQQQQQEHEKRIMEQDQQQAMFLIYRRLPPRDRLSVRHPITNEIAMTGCLWETYYVYPTLEEEAKNNANKMVAVNDNSNSNDDDETKEEQAAVAPPPATEPLQLFRQVSPPYVNALVEYPGLLDTLLLPETMTILQEECLQISHWTAWPEQQHYKAKSTSTRENGQEEGAPWNVFPLLYCFPANQVENKTWIEPTCAVVPRTVQLLKEHLGDTLRTALYSRLDPGAVLEAHTGWQDLANHVLRVHLPLIVPNEAAGLAGLWVDGCVECHQVGSVVCFDDSKTHRAFNYNSKESRIVLILDLVREPTRLPPGTAVGGHSEELDKFIEQMSTAGAS